MRDKSGANVKKIVLSLMVLLTLGTASPVAAAPITGVLNITGSVMVSKDTIDWFPPIGPTFGFFLTGNPDEGYFDGIVSLNPFLPSGGQALDLGGPGGPVVPPLPGGTPLPLYLSDFQNVPAEYTDLSFTLETIIPPTAAPCTGTETAVNTVCSLGLFTLRQTSTGVAIGFDVAGSFVDITYGDDGSLNDAVGLYTTQIPGATIASITTTIDAGGTISGTYSAAFTASAVPEPATLLTFGIGTAVLAAHRRRRAKKEAKA